MIRNSDWQAVHEELTAEDRRRLGAPPTDEELDAYSQGKLGPEDEARVRALLVCYPELAREMAAEFPADDAAPGDDGFLSEHEISRQWENFRQHAQPPVSLPVVARVDRFRHVPFAVAATLAVLFAGLYWQAESNSRRLSAALQTPRILEAQQVMPDGRRGGGDEGTTITVERDGALLVVPLISQPHFKDYRIDLLDRATHKSVWTSIGGHRGDDDSFLVVLPRELLKEKARFQLTVYGVDGTREETLATYSIRVAAK